MKNISLKVAGVFATLAFAVVAVPASALTNTELAELLRGLGVSESVIAAVTAAQGGSSVGGSSAACGPFGRDLTVGSTGSDVVALQTFLEEQGRLTIPTGVSKGYFGDLTRAALGAWQGANGISPTAGYFGPITKAKVATMCGTTTGGGTTGGGTTGGGTTTGLQGGAGSLDEVKFASSINNEEVGEGQEDVEVLGLDVKPENSDISLAAVKLTFDQDQGAKVSGSATRLNKYADEVSVWLDGKELARVDAGDFTKDSTGVYSKTISLDSAVIEDGEVGELVVAVSAVGNLDSADAGEEWGVKVASLRYEDAQGAIITDSSPADLNTYRTFSFEDFSTASAMKFRILGGDSSINTARTIEVSSTTRTTDEAVLSFKMKIEGDSGMNVDEVVIYASTTNTTIANVISAAYLYVDGDRVGSESITGTGDSITFDDLDLDLDAGETYDAEVRVDFQKATGAFVSGSTIEVDATSTSAWVIEDENGDNVATGDRKGTASADAHSLVTAGPNFKKVSLTPNRIVGTGTTPEDSVEVKLVVDITAIGDSLYIATSSAAFNATVIGAATTTGATFTTYSNATKESGYYRVDEGSTETFTLTVTVPKGNLLPGNSVSVSFDSVVANTGSVGAGSDRTLIPTSAYVSESVVVVN